MPLRFAFFALVSSLVIGCSSDDDGKPPPPDHEVVFGSLQPPTPNKLSGVWETNTTLADGTQVSTRILFMESYAVGAARCIPQDRSRSLVAGGAADLETTALALASGTLKMKALNFSARDGNLSCAIALAGNTYDFSIVERKLTLAASNSPTSVAFEKVGDR